MTCPECGESVIDNKRAIDGLMTAVANGKEAINGPGGWRDVDRIQRRVNKEIKGHLHQLAESLVLMADVYINEETLPQIIGTLKLARKIIAATEPGKSDPDPDPHPHYTSEIDPESYL